MDIYLIRHGRAEPRGEHVADADRALTEEGRERVEAIVAGLDRTGIRLDLVLTSPWRRAAATAEYLVRLGSPPIREEPLLAAPPGPSLLEAVTAAAADGADAVALVGHEPWLSELLAWLTTGDPDRAGAFVMKKGGVARLAGRPRPGKAHLVALLPPALFRTLAP